MSSNYIVACFVVLGHFLWYREHLENDLICGLHVCLELYVSGLVSK